MMVIATASSRWTLDDVTLEKLQDDMSTGVLTSYDLTQVMELAFFAVLTLMELDIFAAHQTGESITQSHNRGELYRT